MVSKSLMVEGLTKIIQSKVRQFLLPYALVAILPIYHFAHAQKSKHQDVLTAWRNTEDTLSTALALAAQFRQEHSKSAAAHFLEAEIIADWGDRQPFYHAGYAEQMEKGHQAYGLAMENLKKIDLAINKNLYAELLQTEMLNLPTVRFLLEKQWMEFRKKWANTQQARLALSEIEKHSGEAQRVYRQLNRQSGLQRLPLDADQTTIGALREVAAQADSIGQHLKILERLQAGVHRQEVVWYPAGELDKPTVWGSRLLLTDYGKWAQSKLAEIDGTIIPLRKKMIEVDTRLSAVTNRLLRGNAYQKESILQEDVQVITQLFQLDHASLAGQMLMYKKLKLEYLILEHTSYLILFSASEKESVDAKKLLQNKLAECRELLLSIQVDRVQAERYSDYLQTVYGGEKGLMEYLREETLFYDKRMGALAGGTDLLAQASPTLPASNGASPVVRSSKYGHANPISFSGLTPLAVFPVPESTDQWMYGTCDSGAYGKQAVFVGRTDERKKYLWLRKFVQQGPNGVEDLRPLLAINPETSSAMLLCLESKLGGVPSFRLAGVGLSGELRFDSPLVDPLYPRQILPLPVRERLVLVSKGELAAESPTEKETASLKLFNRMGVLLNKQVFPLKGKIGEMLPTEDGLLVVVNFLECELPLGKVVSQAATKPNGYNALVLVFDEKLVLQTFKNVPSSEPIFATSAMLQPDGRVILTGKKGEFTINDSFEVENGKEWSEVIEWLEY